MNDELILATLKDCKSHVLDIIGTEDDDGDLHSAIALQCVLVNAMEMRLKVTNSATEE